MLMVVFPEQLSSRLAIYSETLDPSKSTSELYSRSGSYPLQNFLLAFEYPNWPYGYGIGTATLGGQYVTRITHAAPMRIGVESGYGELILELGILGLLLWIVLSIALSLSAWNAAKSLRGLSMVSDCFCDFLVCIPACSPRQLLWVHIIRRFRYECLFLVASRHLIPSADCCKTPEFLIAQK